MLDLDSRPLGPVVIEGPPDRRPQEATLVRVQVGGRRLVGIGEDAALLLLVDDAVRPSPVLHDEDRLLGKGGVGNLEGVGRTRPGVRPVKDTVVGGIARNVESPRCGVVRLVAIGGLPGQAGAVDRAIEVVQGGERLLALDATR